MIYKYIETVDWGIIRRQWVAEEPDFVVVIENHEEDRFTVKVTHRSLDIDYYSYWQGSGKVTFGSLEAAQEFAAGKVAAMRRGDYTHSTGKDAV
jgi:formate-dependent phosphoribosylglycinamide formyltransferase (GAR transformylase)